MEAPWFSTRDVPLRLEPALAPRLPARGAARRRLPVAAAAHAPGDLGLPGRDDGRDDARDARRRARRATSSGSPRTGSTCRDRDGPRRRRRSTSSSASVTSVRRPRAAGVRPCTRCCAHFELVGFDGAPRFLGIDDAGSRDALRSSRASRALAPVLAGDDVAVLDRSAAPGGCTTRRTGFAGRRRRRGRPWSALRATARSSATTTCSRPNVDLPGGLASRR